MNFNEKHAKTSFLDHSREYLSRNWSVIPVWGTSQPDHFKVAAIKWNRYCHRLPTLGELHHWFKFGKHQGIAIITGRISKLAVLDFDSEATLRIFSQAYPHLLNTYTVKTPRGHHLYYEIPDTCTTKTRKGQGIDWQWERRYVVAPPTQGYSIQIDQKPRVLSQEDIATIESFIDAQKAVFTRNDPSGNTTGILGNELLAYYSKQAIPGERNDSLFKSGLLARDHGWTLRETIETLASVHAHNRHSHESQEARHREAIATLKSVFSRPPRKLEGIRQLPNTIREKLFSIKQAGVVRLIEGLRLKGYEPGQTITWQQAWHELYGIVGRDTIINALNALSDAGIPLFEKYMGYETPSPRPPTPEKPASLSPEGNDIKCLMVRGAKSGISPKTGAPRHYFRLPSNVELARILGVRLSSITDVLTLDDLRSAKTTRQVLHYGLVGRKPGKHSNTWLTSRLGISKTTKNRYDRALKDLHKLATYSMKAIYWNNLDEISDEFDIPGQFLEDDTGKRYPAKRVLAIKLLKQKRKVRLMRQGVNYYWVGHRFEADTKALVTVIQNNRVMDEPDFSDYWRDIYSQPAAQKTHRAPNRAISGHSPATATQYSGRNGTILKSNSSTSRNSGAESQKSMVDETTVETEALYVQERINRMVSAPQHQLSLSNARRLVTEYGLYIVQNVLERIESRHDVQNPAGLLIVILRSEAKWRVG